MPLDTLIEKIVDMQNPTVAGLDPTIENIPAFIRQRAFKKFGENPEGAAAALLEFNKGLIDALCGTVPAVKPQCAYYERYGWQGMRALALTISYAREKGMYVITDGKRGDIGPTVRAYADAHLGKVQIGATTVSPFGADALTVNGYLGTDGIEPLLDVCRLYGGAIYVLVKTSNPSSGELQDLSLGEGTVYEKMGRMCEKWGEALPGKYGYSSVGAVVGATYPKQLSQLRKALPHTFFLVPGYGAQGGSAAGVSGAFDESGLGAVINSSRAILYAFKKECCAPEDYAGAAKREALRMRDDILGQIGRISLKS